MNIKVVIFFILMMYGGFFQNQIVKHIMCLRANGASTFQGIRPKVIALMKMEQNTLFHWDPLYGT